MVASSSSSASSASRVSCSGSDTCTLRQLPSLQCCPCELGRAGKHSSCDASLVSTVAVSFSSGASCAGPTSWYEVRGDDPNGVSPRPAAPSAGRVARHVASGGRSPRRPLLWWLLRPPLLRCASASSASSSGSAAGAPRQLPSLRCCPCGLGRAGRHGSCDASRVSTVGVSFSSGAGCACRLV